MKPLRFVTVPVLAALLLGSSGTATDQQQPPKAAATANPSLESYIPLIAEFDLRRRVNVLFPNPQTLFDGLQVGFVNVAAGNLTFLRRDLVTRANGPVIFGRVYDSRATVNGDFGPGWRLSLSEALHMNEARIAYVDGAGARRVFALGADGYAPVRPTPRHAGTRIVLGANEATLREQDGTKRTFKRAAADRPWLIASVKTNARRLDFRYRDGKLESVVHGTRTLFHVRRDAAGRVAGVRDDHGRSVRYSYTATGKLKDVYDVAGHLWWHEYDANGRLTAAIGANRQPYLEVAYDGNGRVRQSRTGREYTFAYETSQTTVTEGTGTRHTFERNAHGTTVAFRSTNGVHWRVGLNANNRVKMLVLPDRTLDYDYDRAGKITMVQTSSTAGSSREDYAYDDQGRLAAVRSLAGEELLAASYGASSVELVDHGIAFDYKLAPNGRIEAVWDRNVRFDAEYDANGDLTALRHNGYSVRFERDGLGRITAVTYPSGHRNRYFHDLLGNRRLAEYAGGGTVAYRHDQAGNIAAAEITATDGTVRRQTTTVGAMNRVERITYQPGRSLAIGYDRMGRPIEFNDGVQRVLVQHGAHGSVSRITAPATGERLDLDGRSPPRVRTLSERRLAVFSRDMVGAAHPSYGPVRFAETTFDALPLDAAETGVPDLAAARDLFAVALPLFGGSFAWIVKNFEKPSNPVFQPAEYRSTNCCVPYSGETCDENGPTGPGGGVPSFQGTVMRVDQCMRNADARIRAITPHHISYDPPRKEGWKTDEMGAARRCGNAYCTFLNEDVLRRRNNNAIVQTEVWDTLAHEYAHHIWGYRHDGSFESRWEALKGRTERCQH